MRLGAMPIEPEGPAMRKFFGVALATTLSAALAGCGEGGPESRRERLHLPSPGFRPDAGIGREVFETRCAECHGKHAKGTDKGPPLVDQIYRPAHHADLAFHFAVRDGVKQHHWRFGDMPPRPEVTPEQAGHVIAYVRALQRQAGIR